MVDIWRRILRVRAAVTMATQPHMRRINYGEVLRLDEFYDDLDMTEL